LLRSATIRTSASCATMKMGLRLRLTLRIGVILVATSSISGDIIAARSIMVILVVVVIISVLARISLRDSIAAVVK